MILIRDVSNTFSKNKALFGLILLPLFFFF
jgi:hypothetical protein